MATVDIRFDPVEHRYWIDGVEYPSVTTILKAAGVYGEYTDVDPAIIAKAGLRGDAVHEAVAQYLTTGGWATVSPEVEPYVRAFDRWHYWADLEVWAVEQITFSRQHGVAGAIDIVGKLGGEPSIIDVKTTRMLNKVATGYQTAAYRMMWNENQDDPDRHVVKRYALQLRNDGTPRLEPMNDPLDELRFIGMAMKHGRMG